MSRGRICVVVIRVQALFTWEPDGSDCPASQPGSAMPCSRCIDGYMRSVADIKV
jgi:hypothetical protein